MLISQLLKNSVTNRQGNRLEELSAHIGRGFSAAGSLPPAFFDGMCAEIQLLLARMCTPMKAAVEQAQGEPGRMESVAVWIERDLGRCPALDSALSHQARQIAAEYLLAWTRFSFDRPCLQATGILRSGDTVSEVRIASADKHHGQHVLRFSISNSLALFYKPRPGSGAVLLRSLARVLGEWGFTLGAAPTLDFGSHHWMEEIPYVPNLTVSEAIHYAYSGGVLYGIAMLLNSSDLHFENIIATRDGPVVVDCETLCQPRFSHSAAVHLLKRPHDEYADGTSLFLNLDTYCDQPIDYGGLSCVDIWIRKDPYAGLQVQLGSDTRELTKHCSRSAVEVNGLRLAPAVVYFDRFIEGFMAICEVAAQRKTELVSLVKTAAQFRIPLRATRVYAALISERLSGIYFSSYANNAWRRHLDAELEAVEESFLPTARAILELERQEIESLDIPVGYICAGSRDLMLGQVVLTDVFDLSPLEMLQRRLDGVGAQSINEQVAVLRSRLAEAPCGNQQP